MPNLTITAVPALMIDYVWADVEEMFERVILKAHGEITTESIKDSLKRGDTMLVLILEEGEIIALNTLETTEFDTGLKVLAVPCTAGSRLEDWMEDFLAYAEIVAKDLNCTQLRGFCRKGWTKVLKPFGWQEGFVMMVKDIE